jgi:uncharacterized membrane protein (DUF373 family)
MSEDRPEGPRRWIARGYTLVEDVYIGLGLLLTALVLTLLVTSAIDAARTLAGGATLAGLIGVLDRALLVLLIVELLYTVQVSFREHALAPEPFLLIGLISAIRRVLLLTAQIGEAPDKGEANLNVLILEMAVLAGLILALAFALHFVRRSGSIKAQRRE